MKKFFMAVVVFALTLPGLPVQTQAQTYGGNYGGYGNNAFLNRALVLRQSKRKARSTQRKTYRSKRSYRKQVRRSDRSYRFRR